MARVDPAQAGLRARKSWPPAFPARRCETAIRQWLMGDPHSLTVAGAAAGWAREIRADTAFPFHPPRGIRDGHLLRRLYRQASACPLRRPAVLQYPSRTSGHRRVHASGTARPLL